MSSSSSINSLLSSSSSSNSAVNLSSMLAAESGVSTPGIDVTSAVAAAIYADRAPERIWEGDQTTLSSQMTALTSIQSATEALQSDMESLNSLNGPLASRTVTSSNSNYVSATAATGTAAGTHAVVVNTLATQGSWYSDLETSATATLPTSSLTITTTSGATQTFYIGSSSTDGTDTPSATLNDLASAINGDSSLGVTATVMTDSTGSRLSIVSNTAGKANDFTVTSPNFSGSSWTSGVLPTGDTLGANTITLTTSAGTATVQTTSGETYAQLAAAIKNAQIYTTATGYTSTQSSLSSSTALTAGTVTTITDASTNSTFTYTATSGSTIGDLNNAIANAVSSGTLSANVTGSIVNGQETISEGSSDAGITVSTTDSALGSMYADAGVGVALGLTATANSGSSGTSLSVTSSSGTFSINEPAYGFTQANVATDATGTVDGVPFDSATDSVTGVLPGVTMTLQGVTNGSAVELTVGSNTSAISSSINQFVSDYNTAINLVNAQFQVSSSTDSSGNQTSSEGVLAQDATVQGLQSVLESAMGYLYTPSSGTTTTVSTLADLGITMNDDGTLSVDSTTLDNALTTDPTDVQNFFEGTALNGFANSFYSTLNVYTEPSAGAFQVDLNSMTAENSELSSEISDFESNYISEQLSVLTADFSKAEEALQSLPEQMQQLNAELGFNSSSSNG